MKQTVSTFVTKWPARFANSISLLDELLAQFPRACGIPFNMAYFRNGVSDYLKSALKDKSSKGKATSQGLGSMRFQDMPSLLLQLLICNLKSLLTSKAQLVNYQTNK